MRRAIATVCAVLALAGCGRKWDNPLETPPTRFATAGNNPPSAPSHPSPPDSATNQPLSLNLSWSCSDPDAGDTVRYTIFFDTINPPATVIAANHDVAVLFWSGLDTNHLYFWRVRAVDNHRDSSIGLVWRFKTGVFLPSPQLFSPANGDTGLGTSPILNWNTLSGATSYTVQVSKNSGFSSFIYNQSGLTGTSFTTNGLDSSTIYYWRVNASNASGTSSWSLTWNFKTVSKALPSIPQLVTPVNGDSGLGTSPVLNWNPSASTISYTVQVSKNIGFSSFVYNQSGLTGTSFTTNGLDSSTIYYWRVNASNATGTSAWSPTWRFTTVFINGPLPSAGLVAYYPFQGNTRDSSGHGHHGTAYFITYTSDRFGNVGNASSFNGSTSYVEVPYSAELNPTDQITVSAWVKADIWGGLEYSNSIIDCDDIGYLSGYVLRGGATTTGFIVSCSGWQAAVSNPGTVTVDTWYNLVGRRDGSTVKLYINGTEAASTICSGSLGSSHMHLRIGTDNSSLRYFDGVIDDVRIYNRALSTTEINILYHEGGWKGRR